MKTSIILPTYNEAGNIFKLIDTLTSVLDNERFPFELVIVDDNSPDKTGYLVKEKYKNDPRIKCLIREERGSATAIKFGIYQASGDKILIMDTDFNHDPFQVPELIAFSDKYDICSASRYVWGGGMQGSQLRYWGSYFFNIFTRIILRLKSKDCLSGFFAFNRKILDSLDLDKIFTGYGDYFIKFLYQAKKTGLSLIEIPTVYRARCEGKSKTNMFLYLPKYIFTVLNLRFKGL